MKLKNYFALYFLERLHKQNVWKCNPKKLWQNAICMEQQIYTSLQIFTQPLVVMVKTFRRSLLVEFHQEGSALTQHYQLIALRQGSQLITLIWPISNIHIILRVGWGLYIKEHTNNLQDNCQFIFLPNILNCFSLLCL